MSVFDFGRSYRADVDRWTAKRDVLQEYKDKLEADLKGFFSLLKDLEQARETVTGALLLTYEEAAGFLESVVGYLLKAICGKAYGFKLRREIKANRPQFVPVVVRNDEEYEPGQDEIGGGVVDILSLGFRLALWALVGKGKFMLLDEPGRFLDADNQAAFGRMLKTFAAELGLQIVLITHSTAMGEQVDRLYMVSQEKGVAYVEQITG